MDPAVERFQNLLRDNNLTVSLDGFTIKKVDDGSIIIPVPNLLVKFTDPKKELPKDNAPLPGTIQGEVINNE